MSGKMLHVASILERLQALEDYVEKVKPYQSWTLEALVDDYRAFWVVLRGLQLASQCLMDISAHIQVSLGFETADDYKKVILSLGKHDVLPRDFAERIQEIPGFRNVLVHEYLTVDPAIVYDCLQHGLINFEEFVEHVYDFLRREGYLEEPAEEGDI